MMPLAGLSQKIGPDLSVSSQMTRTSSPTSQTRRVPLEVGRNLKAFLMVGWTRETELRDSRYGTCGL